MYSGKKIRHGDKPTEELVFSVLRQALGLNEIEEKILLRITTNANVIRLRKGQVLIAQGDIHTKTYFVLKGQFKLLAYSKAGVAVGLSVLFGPGRVIGDHCFQSGRVAELNVIPVSDAEVLAIESTDIDSLTKIYPQVSEVILASVHRRLSAMGRHYVEAVSLNVEHRVAAVLLALFKRHGRVVPCTHGDLAELVGCSRESVSREIKKLADAGAISRRRGAFMLVDRDKLKQLSA